MLKTFKQKNEKVYTLDKMYIHLEKLYTKMKKYITKYRIIYFIVWAVVFGSLFYFLINNPGWTELELDRITEVEGKMFYLDDAFGLSGPPPAYYIYSFQKKWGGIIRMVAFGVILLWSYLNRAWLKKAWKKIQAVEMNDK